MRDNKKRCATCDTELGPTGYIQVRTASSGLRYYCNRGCLYETCNYEPEIYNSIRSVMHKGGRRRGEAV